MKVMPQRLQAGARGDRASPRSQGRTWTRRSWRPLMGDITGFLKHGRETADPAAGAGAPARLEGGLRAVPRRPPPGAGRRGAWTAASRSATTAARSATSSPTGTTSCTATAGATPSTGCTPPTTSRSSPAGCARRRARARACSASTRTRSRSSRSRSRSSTGPGTRAGSCRCRRRPPPASAVAVVGSGPAGLAAAQQLTRAGHASSCSSGPTASAGCCATASPSSRWRSGTSTVASPRWRPRAPSSAPAWTSASTCHVDELRGEFDALVLAGGATAWRDLPIPGRELGGIHQAMEYLPWSNRAQEGDLPVDDVPINAGGKDVVIIGGGDTGADCLGTAHRQGARVDPPVRDPAPARRRSARRPTRGPPTR